MSFQQVAKCDGPRCGEIVPRHSNERMLPPGWLRRVRSDYVGSFQMDMRSVQAFEVELLFCPRCSQHVDPPLAPDLAEQQAAVLRTLVEKRRTG